MFVFVAIKNDLSIYVTTASFKFFERKEKKLYEKYVFDEMILNHNDEMSYLLPELERSNCFYDS